MSDYFVRGEEDYNEGREVFRLDSGEIVAPGFLQEVKISEGYRDEVVEKIGREKGYEWLFSIEDREGRRRFFAPRNEDLRVRAGKDLRLLSLKRFDSLEKQHLSGN